MLLVKKVNRQSQMCVNFISLNQACPKDSFPLLRIDQLVDPSVWNGLLTFMDAFSDYNKIQMSPAD